MKIKIYLLMLFEVGVFPINAIQGKGRQRTLAL